MRVFNKHSVKIAIVHDIFLHFGGAERVLLTLIKLFPQADLFIPLINKEFINLVKSKKHKGKINASFFNKIPVSDKYASLLKPYIFWYWEHLDLSVYDLVISSSHSFSSKSVVTKPETLHISYIHTSPKYLYDQYNEMQFINKFPIKHLISPLIFYLRRLDYLGAQRPDILVANSKAVQKRISKYYNRGSYLINPPLSIPRKLEKRKKSYYLFFSRLVKQKGPELAIRAFNDLGKHLLVVGIGSEERKLKKIAAKNVIFKGFVSDSTMYKVYSEAKALVYCAIDEDFGMIPAESMSHGVPVIAYKSGGVSETVIDGETGLLFDNHTTDDLKNAVLKFERMRFSVTACRKQARQFSEDIFSERLINLISDSYER